MQLTPETRSWHLLFIQITSSFARRRGLHLLRLFGVRVIVVDFCLRQHGLETLSIKAGVLFSRQIQSSLQFGDNFLLAGLVAVTVQREVTQLPIVEAGWHCLRRRGPA